MLLHLTRKKCLFSVEVVIQYGVCHRKGSSTSKELLLHIVWIEQMCVKLLIPYSLKDGISSVLWLKFHTILREMNITYIKYWEWCIDSDARIWAGKFLQWLPEAVCRFLFLFFTDIFNTLYWMCNLQRTCARKQNVKKNPKKLYMSLLTNALHWNLLIQTCNHLFSVAEQ